MTRYLLGLAVLSIALLAPATAPAAWMPPEEVGSIEPSNQGFRLASNDRGDTVILWSDDRGAQVSVSRRGGEFGPPLEVPGSKGGYNADVILNEDGRAIVHWRKFVAEFRQRVELVGLKVDGGFGQPRAVTPADQYVTFRPAIGPNGRFTIVYTVGQRFRPVYARIAPPSGKLGRRITLASGAVNIADLWYLGNRPMTAYRQASDDKGRLRERQVGSGGSRVVATVPKHGQIEIDTASNGRQIAVWTDDKTSLFAAVRRPGRSFGKGKLLENRYAPQEMAAAIARSGEGIVAWRDWNESTTEGGESPTPEGHPGTLAYSYHWRTSFSAIGRIRPGEGENAAARNLSADINSDGLGVLAWIGGRFEGMDRRLYSARVYRGDDPVLEPLSGFGPPFFGIDRIEVDERSRTAFGWLDQEKVYGLRGTWGINQP